jgi:hypothetical protein
MLKKVGVPPICKMKYKTSGAYITYLSVNDKEKQPIFLV